MNYSPGAFGFACPQYKDSTCCNFYQNEYLSFNFLLISTPLCRVVTRFLPPLTPVLHRLRVL